MGRLLRRTLDVLTFCSLALCAATVGVWVRSHYVGDRYEWQPATRDRTLYAGYVVSAGKGNLTFHVCRQRFSRALLAEEEDHLTGDAHNPLQRGYHAITPARAYKWAWPVTHVDRPERFIVWHVAYPVRHDEWRPPLRETYEWDTYACPCYAIALPAAVLPIAVIPRRLRERRASRRASRGLCAGCGYDLRATPGRCPECGRLAEGVIGAFP